MKYPLYPSLRWYKQLSGLYGYMMDVLVAVRPQLQFATSLLPTALLGELAAQDIALLWYDEGEESLCSKLGCGLRME